MSVTKYHAGLGNQERKQNQEGVRLPFTKDEMLAVSGVGEYKYGKYGERFVGRIRDFMDGRKEKLYFGELEKATSETRGGNGQKGAKAEFSLTAGQAEKFSALMLL